ncbi:MAG TPA: NUDIX domain-containing protein [Tepidisphaeraceae bacterium]|nr:NUDIX domain-containing protein [Tepidisphaeraceae bacterium]
MNVRHDMVCCFVIRPDAAGTGHELLQLRRSPGEYLAGAWSTVRGGIEPGETAWAAALRELREEAGLIPDEFFQLDTVDLFYLWGDDTLWHCPGFCAVVSRSAVVKLNDEHDAIRWTPRDRIDRDFIWPGERAQLAELTREILDNGPAKAYLRIPPEKWH